MLTIVKRQTAVQDSVTAFESVKRLDISNRTSQRSHATLVATKPSISDETTRQFPAEIQVILARHWENF